VTSAPAEWIGPAFNAEVLSSAPGRAAFRRHDKDLPSDVIAVRVDGTPLLIGELKGPPSQAVAADQTRRYRNQATIARSWLGAEGPNLQLFLIGPEGALRDGNWLQLAAAIEVDDRICRKLVWLFDKAPTLESALQFLGRTFMATPWDKEQRVKEQLDRMTNVGLPSGWQAAVDNEDLDAEALVNEIIRLEGDLE
jgi:ABC-3C biological conflict system middle component